MDLSGGQDDDGADKMIPALVIHLSIYLSVYIEGNFSGCGVHVGR